MAFHNPNLSVIEYGNGFTLWHYATADSADAVGASGYFDPAAGLRRTGDMILANVGRGSAFYLVSSDTNSVAVRDLLAAKAPEPGAEDHADAGGEE